MYLSMIEKIQYIISFLQTDLFSYYIIPDSILLLKCVAWVVLTDFEAFGIYGKMCHRSRSVFSDPFNFKFGYRYAKRWLDKLPHMCCVFDIAVCFEIEIDLSLYQSVHSTCCFYSTHVKVTMSNDRSEGQTVHCALAIVQRPTCISTIDGNNESMDLNCFELFESLPSTVQLILYNLIR